MVENREVKSDVFSMLMEDKRNALEVYNALNGSDYSDPELIEMVTLEKGISLTIRNDAAFILDANINIYEHQSTYNPNMPLRAFLYLASTLKLMLKKKDLFGGKLTIPTPHFAVFYNGTKNRPDKEVMLLSELFSHKECSPELELKCTVYNINSGTDNGILNKCIVLNEYTQFVEKVRYYESINDESPISTAIDWCIENHILEEFLIGRGQEVIKVMTLDMTFEHRMEIRCQEALEEGRQEGLQEGRQEGLQEGRQEGLQEGRQSIISTMLLAGKTAEEIADFCNIPLDEVIGIEKELVK